MSKNQDELRNQQTDRKTTQSPKEESNKQNVASNPVHRKDDDRKNTKGDSHKESTNEREKNPAAPNTKDRK